MAAVSLLRTRLGCASLLLSATFLTASCGGTGGRPGTVSDGRDTVTNGTVTHRPTHGTGGKEVNDDNPGSADSGDSTHGADNADSGDNSNSSDSGDRSPCALVSRVKAQAIIGKPIEAPQEAPLGPTCIYQPAGGASAGNTVMVAIESIDPSMLKVHLHKQVRFKLAGHTAYCGVYGQTTTFVPLSGDGVLTIAAPCPVGKLFAAAALRDGSLR